MFESPYRSPYKNSHLRRSPFRRSTYGGADAVPLKDARSPPGTVAAGTVAAGTVAAGTVAAAAALNDHDESDDDNILLTEINEYISHFIDQLGHWNDKWLQVNSVIIESGHSFGKKNIEEWFKRNDTCPITLQKVSTTLIPNLNLRSSIERFVSKYANREGEAWENIRELCEIYIEQKSEAAEREAAERAQLAEDIAQRERSRLWLEKFYEREERLVAAERLAAASAANSRQGRITE